jgi:transcription elongation factor GreA-like protein
MIIKSGSFVRHTGARQWGAGKVTEVVGARATIQFSDGITRKISSSHYTSLQQADPASFVPLPEPVHVPARVPTRRAKK